MLRSAIVRASILVSAFALLGACSSDNASAQNNGATGGAANSGGASGTAGTGVGGAAGVAGTASGGTAGAACLPQSYAADALQSGEQLFKGVALSSSTPIADIVAAPAGFEGKVVRVEGFIVEICQDQGCYVTLQGPTGEKVNLKVVDGALDFRQHTKLGNYAIGEGPSQQAGEHGAQIFIQEHGAVIGSQVCADYAGG